MTDKELNSHDLAREIEIVKLQEENEELKSQLRGTTHCFDEEEHNRLKEENQKLKKQLKYLRSGEYYNQLRFERDMLQQVVDTNGVPSEVYDYIDCTHRNTELLEQQQEFIKYLTSYIELLNNKPDLIEESQIDILEEILQKYKEITQTKNDKSV